MARLVEQLSRVFDGAIALVRRVIFAGVELDEKPSAFPPEEDMVLLDGDRLGGGADRYAAIAGEVMRAVIETSPRHATEIHLHSTSLEPPAGMDRLAAITHFDPDDTPDGRVDATRDTVDAVARMLGPDLRSVTVVDQADRPIVRWEDGRGLTFGLPATAREGLADRLPDPAVDALRQVETQA